jgi:hydroxymethylpyrimidine pyrophosphatase-like HAD family hydrolase
VPYAFQAIAVDYDGTITDASPPAPEVLAVLREQRAQGRKVVLVTGRILAELRNDYPHVDDEFDLIVAENGGVISHEGRIRELATPVSAELAAALTHSDVPVRQGRVLLATDTAYDRVVLDEIARLGLEYQMVRNRHALMVLPPGITKGVGLYEALGDLGISHHSTIGVGDAENDHSLLEVCEIGVAVSNAVDALKQHADLVLDQPDGAGVSALLNGPVLSGEQRLYPRRWQIEIGTDDDEPVRIPASQINVLITGGSLSGKSHMVGLLAEELVDLDYSMLMLDIEGDHGDLARLRGVLSVGGPGRLPDPSELPGLLRHRFASIVVDLSRLGLDQRAAYLTAAVERVSEQRSTSGLPHWMIIDEAHLADLEAGFSASPSQTSKGYCLVTYKPTELSGVAPDDFDIVIATLGGADQAAMLPGNLAALTGLDERTLESDLTEGTPGRAVLVDRRSDGPPVWFTGRPRRTDHVRHWHKYLTGSLPTPRRFYFRDGAVAANLTDFYRQLRTCDLDIVAGHAHDHDFSRWIADVLQDLTLATAIRAAEADLTRPGNGGVQLVRQKILARIRARYIE